MESVKEENDNDSMNNPEDYKSDVSINKNFRNIDVSDIDSNENVSKNIPIIEVESSTSKVYNDTDSSEGDY